MTNRETRTFTRRWNRKPAYCLKKKNRHKRRSLTKRLPYRVVFLLWRRLSDHIRTQPCQCNKTKFTELPTEGISKWIACGADINGYDSCVSVLKNNE